MVGALLSICGHGQSDPGTDIIWPDLAGNWAMVQTVMAVADLPIVGNLLIYSVIGGFTHITQSGSQLILQDSYCFTNISTSTFLFRTSISDVTMRSIRPQPRTAELILIDCDFHFTQDWHTEIRGAVLENPVTEQLPVDSDDPRLVDMERDGHPGMTIRASIFGVFRGEGYVVQRYRYRLQGTVVDANTIIGFIDWTSEQTVIAATNTLFTESFSGATHSDPTRHRFVMIRVDETWSCETLRRQLPRLRELLDF